jgi:hypothetical protein
MKLTQTQLLKEASNRYPKGTKVKTPEVFNEKWNTKYPYLTSNGIFELDRDRIILSNGVGLEGKIKLILNYNNEWREVYNDD